MAKKRNGLIEILRFIAAFSIMLFHYEWLYLEAPKHFNYFYVWVEFFFVISGFFLAINIDKNKGVSTKEYFLSQLKKIYPLYIVAFVFSFVVYFVLNHAGLTFGEVMAVLWKAKWEIILTYILGFSNIFSFNDGGAAAYIPALLFGTLIYHYLYKNHRKLTGYVIIPLIIVFGLQKMIFKGGNLSQWYLYDGLISLGLIRALVDIGIGIIFANLVYPKFNNIKNNVIKYLLNIFILLFTLVTIVLLVIYRNYITASDLIIWIIIFGFMISSANVVGNKLPNFINKLFCFLGKLSFPIFLFHYPVITLLKKYYDNKPYFNSSLVLSISVLLLAVIIIIIEWLIKLVIKKINHKNNK